VVVDGRVGKYVTHNTRRVQKETELF